MLEYGIATMASVIKGFTKDNVLVNHISCMLCNFAFVAESWLFNAYFKLSGLQSNLQLLRYWMDFPC